MRECMYVCVCGVNLARACSMLTNGKLMTKAGELILELRLPPICRRPCLLDGHDKAFLRACPVGF